MTDSSRTSPGRPKIYETSSERLGAFRSRQEGAGYLRKEVLVTRATSEWLAQLAKAHGVTLTDAASALLEYGLETFTQTHGAGVSSATPADQARTLVVGASFAPSAGGQSGSLGIASSLRATSLSASSAIGSSQPVLSSQAAVEATAADNPILRFFANRRQETKK